MPARVLNVGVLGLGAVSGPHIEAVLAHAGSRLLAVCDVDEAKVARVARDLGVAAYTRWPDVLADDAIDAVLVLLPHRLHGPVACAALRAGKHVSIEKPMAVTSAECREMVALARERALVLAVAENTRFVSAYEAAFDVVWSGGLGDLRLLRAFVYGSAIDEFREPSGAWKIQEGGVGAIVDAAPHFLYLMRWFFGSVRHVQAVSRHWVRDHEIPGSEVEDGATVSGVLENGAYFTTDYALGVEVAWGERLELYGTERSLIVDQLNDPVAVLYDGAADLHGRPLAGVAHDVKGWKLRSIRRAATDFLDAVLDDRPPAVDPADAAYCIELVEAAYRSVADGGARVMFG